MVRRAQAALRSVEHTSVRQLRVLAAIVFLFAMVIATVAPAVTAPMAFADSSTSSSSSSSSSSVDYATWAEVSKAMDKQLNSGLKTYKDGNTAGATSDFMGAYNKIYVASNFTAVVHDTIGADKQLAQQQAFQSVQNLSYTPSNDDQLAQQIDALTADLDATAQQLDTNADLAKPKAYAEALQAQLAKERKELDAKKKKNPGKGNRSWTDVANEMTPILDNAYKAYEKGDGAKGATLVNNAYYQYYEKLGFEKNVMNAISGNRVSQVEYQFKMCRKSMNAGASLKDTKKLIDDLKAMLIKDAGILDGGAADKEDGFTKLVTSSSGQAFLVLIREGLEALLVVAAIVAYLVKSDNKRFVKWIYLGVL
ncbi:FTR1 family protein, partial [Bifidobacterium longum]